MFVISQVCWNHIFISSARQYTRNFLDSHFNKVSANVLTHISYMRKISFFNKEWREKDIILSFCVNTWMIKLFFLNGPNKKKTSVNRFKLQQIDFHRSVFIWIVRFWNKLIKFWIMMEIWCKMNYLYLNFTTKLALNYHIWDLLASILFFNLENKYIRPFSCI